MTAIKHAIQLQVYRMHLTRFNWALFASDIEMGVTSGAKTLPGVPLFFEIFLSVMPWVSAEHLGKKLGTARQGLVCYDLKSAENSIGFLTTLKLYPVQWQTET